MLSVRACDGLGQLARNLPPAIEDPQLGIMSANLTVNHPNISVWVTIEQKLIILTQASVMSANIEMKNYKS